MADSVIKDDNSQNNVATQGAVSENSATKVVNVAESQVLNAVNQVGQAGDQALQVGTQTVQAVGQIGGQAFEAGANTVQAVGQMGGQAVQAAGQVGQQAQYLVSQTQGTVDQSRQLVQDFLMPKDNQPKVAFDEKIFAMVSYIPLVALICLIIKSESKYVLLHGRQGLILTILGFLNVLLVLFPYIGPMLFGLVGFIIFIVTVYSGYQALIGNWWKIPVLGDLAELIPVNMFAKVTREVLTGQAMASNDSTTIEMPSQAQPEGPVEQKQTTAPGDGVSPSTGV